ncbi:MAG TPA: DUF3313 family protein [Hyphomonadaceae bacterium]|nr:DUF3313 family protein [Hyphomonadaceae bacterium]
MKHVLNAALAAMLVVSAPIADAQKKKAPTEWDGLQKVAAKKFDLAYLLPGADFKAYTKVMLDPAEAAFRKNWQKDYNSSNRSLDMRISDDEAREMLTAVRTAFDEILAQTYRDNGYEVVTTPGPDVMRLKTAVFNIDVDAPDQMTASRTRVYSSEAGRASLMVEVRDSMSGAVLARGIDSRDVGDMGFTVRRSRVSNRADFERVFKTWSQMSVDGLATLKAMPPIGVAVAQN